MQVSLMSLWCTMTVGGHCWWEAWVKMRTSWASQSCDLSGTGKFTCIYWVRTVVFTLHNLLVQLSIFLIDVLVGTYRLSSHARLEAFVIQTKLNFHTTLLKRVDCSQSGYASSSC